MDQPKDFIQRHEMDTTNVPNAVEAEAKGKIAEKTFKTSNTAAQKIYASSPRKRAPVRRFVKRKNPPVLLRRFITGRNRIDIRRILSNSLRRKIVEIRLLRNGRCPQRFDSRSRFHILFSPRPTSKMLVISKRMREFAAIVEETSRGGRAKRVESHWESQRKDGAAIFVTSLECWKRVMIND